MKTGRALTGIKKFCPNVTTVRDATRHAKFEVNANDAKKGGKKDHMSCAIALSCKRKFNLDAVIVSRRVVYFIKKKTATRYIMPESGTREMVAFDRGGQFAPGTYEVKKPREYMKLGHKQGPHPTKEFGRGPKKTSYRHITAGIRAAL